MERIKRFLFLLLGDFVCFLCDLVFTHGLRPPTAIKIGPLNKKVENRWTKMLIDE